MPKILWEQPGGPWMVVGTSCPLSSSPFPRCSARGVWPPCSFFPAGGLARHPLVSPPLWGVQHPSPTAGQAPTSEPAQQPCLLEKQPQAQRGGAQSSRSGYAQDPGAIHPPPPSRNQFPKHPACGLLTPWLPGLEEGPLSHETSIRCPLIGTQSACSSLERAGHKLEETTPGPGGAVHRGPRRGLGAQGRQTLLRGSVARKDSEEAAGGAMGPGDGR